MPFQRVWAGSSARWYRVSEYNRSPVGRCRLSSDTRYQRADEPADPRWNGTGEVEGHGGRRVFYPGMGRWNNVDFQDEWKHVDERGRLTMAGPS